MLLGESRELLESLWYKIRLPVPYINPYSDINNIDVAISVKSNIYLPQLLARQRSASITLIYIYIYKVVLQSNDVLLTDDDFKTVR